jgi:tetratricopeptide (TPR) repeat protein
MLLPAALPLFAQEPATDPEEATLDPWIAAGDAAWALRAEGHEGSVALRERIGEAVNDYQTALSLAPRELERRRRLLRALYFLGDYTGLDDQGRLTVFEQGRVLGEAGIQQLAERVGGRDQLAKLEPREVAAALGDDENAVAIFFWSAVHWGLWGETRGKFAAARQGVGSKIRRYGEIVVALDETFQNATGHQVLGRLNSEAPRIPFFTSWVDRDVAAEHLERAILLAPQDLGNRLYLAECLLEHHHDRRAEAIALLEHVATAEPNAERLVEDLRVIEDARSLLSGLAR